MQSKLLRAIFTINSALLRLFSLVLITFGFYIIRKTGNVEWPNELAAFSITFGTLIVVTFVVYGVAQSRQKNRLFIVTVCLHAACLSSCASVIFMYSAYQQQLNAFFSRQIDILWTVKDSSLVHKKFVFFLQKSIDCCKVHNLVEVLLKLLEMIFWKLFNSRLITISIYQDAAVLMEVLIVELVSRNVAICSQFFIRCLFL